MGHLSLRGARSLRRSNLQATQENQWYPFVHRWRLLRRGEKSVDPPRNDRQQALPPTTNARGKVRLDVHLNLCYTGGVTFYFPFLQWLQDGCHGDHLYCTADCSFSTTCRQQRMRKHHPSYVNRSGWRSRFARPAIPKTCRCGTAGRSAVRTGTMPIVPIYGLFAIGKGGPGTRTVVFESGSFVHFTEEEKCQAEWIVASS